MADTLFADVSYYQPVVNDTYPYKFLSFRSNDGTFRDPNFAKNLAWAKASCATGRLEGFIVYFVWRTNWQQTIATLKSMVGTPHPQMAVMLDVESWSGKLTGNQSVGINAAREDLIKWLGGNRKRVIGYGNYGDLTGLWAQRGDAKIILANYSSNPAFPNKIAHQFSSTFYVPPFGKCDINSADGYSPEQFAIALGIAGTHSAPKPVVVSPTPTAVVPAGGYEMVNGYIHRYAQYAGKPWKGVYLVNADLTRKIHITDQVSLKFLASTKLYPVSGLTDLQADSIPNA